MDDIIVIQNQNRLFSLEFAGILATAERSAGRQVEMTGLSSQIYTPFICRWFIGRGQNVGQLPNQHTAAGSKLTDSFFAVAEVAELLANCSIWLNNSSL